MSDLGIDLGNAIAERWHATGAALGWSPFEELAVYRSLLQKHGVDCNETYRHFAEGVYPIDLDDHALEALSVDGGTLLDELSPDDLSARASSFWRQTRPPIRSVAGCLGIDIAMHAGKIG
jgi:hypothetical protein